MDALWIATCAVLGLLIGSFLTVVVDRVPDGRSVISPPSACPHCDHRLGGRDLVPVVSWVAHRGRCRHCGASIGWEPIIVEVACAVGFVVMGLRFGPTMTAIPYFVLVAAMVALSWVDLRDRRLPREISYTATAISGAVMVTIAVVTGQWQPISSAVIGASAATIAMAVIYVVSRGGMGEGDVRVSPLLGLHLGYLGLLLVPIGFFLGFLFGAVVGVLGILTGLAGRKSGLPLGPFLALGTVVTILFGDAIVEAWLGTA